MEIRITVRHPVGLHARPAAAFVQAATKYVSSIQVRNLSTGSQTVDAKSILGVLTLGVERGHEIGVQAEGANAEDALATIQALVEDDFGQG
jgi:phosphotransferase system HPr (HPr) family protein